MSATGIILSLINVAIIVAVLILVGAVILWFASWMQIAVPQNVQRAYLILVFLIALYYVVSLLIGLPLPGPIHVLR